ncbi:hypothetical protein NQ315_016729 [Exocentrus adspersus]|uniref:Reverse transcriptase domain-containing protein n=1 Tax=Exocentrus adspersus TaxID=1586481 RepID=A0AAV8VFU3_9CUCU|nr:hypothetical protein NQ315_016729 [Exocentrus adspersus]
MARKLHLLEVITVFYADDILIIGSNEFECKSNTVQTVNLLRNLGFIINLEKSILDPQKNIKFLGFLYNTQTMYISLPPEKKILDIKEVIKRFKNKIVREFARLIGKLVSSCPATRYGFLHIKPLEIIKNSGDY